MAIPRHWASTAQAWVDYAFEINRHGGDHALTLVAADATTGRTAARFSRRSAICDRAALEDSTAALACRLIAAAAQSASWMHDADSHYSHAAHSILQGLSAAFPVARRPRKPWVSDATLSMIDARRPWRNALIGARQQRRRHLQTYVLRHWRGAIVEGVFFHYSPLPPAETCGSPRREAGGPNLVRTETASLRGCQRSRSAGGGQQRFELVAWTDAPALRCTGTAHSTPSYTRTRTRGPSDAYATALLERSSEQLKAALRNDRAAHLATLQRQLREAATTGDTRRLYALQKKLKPYTPQPTAPLRDLEGNLILTAAEEQTAWKQLVVSRHGAFEASDTWLSDTARSAAAKLRASTQLDIAAIATPTDLIGQFTHARRRTFGADRMPQEFIRAAPRQMALLATPLFMKSMLSFYEPMAFRGACLAFFPKPGKPSLAVDEFRKIGLFSVLGGLHRKLLRRKLGAALGPHFGHNQCAGFQRRATDCAVLP